MSRPGMLVALVVTAMAGVGCQRSEAAGRTAGDSLVMQEREARLDQALAGPDSAGSDKPVALWHLPDQLREISGLALTADGRLLTHGDQRGRVFEVDYRRGVIVKEFTVGSPAVHGDFEAITIVGDTVMLMTSAGVIYRFPEGGKDATVPYTMTDSGLGDECEFEGMTYEPASKLLLLACKKVHDKALKDSLVIFRLPLTPGKDGKAQKATHLAIPVAAVIGANGWDKVEPSDIAIDPFNGNYLIVVSRQQGLLEITPAGKVVFARPLPPGHDQAEGVAITKDHLLLVSDEAKGGPAAITLYRWP